MESWNQLLVNRNLHVRIKIREIQDKIIKYTDRHMMIV